MCARRTLVTHKLVKCDFFFARRFVVGPFAAVCVSIEFRRSAFPASILIVIFSRISVSFCQPICCVAVRHCGVFCVPRVELAFRVTCYGWVGRIQA